MKIKLNLFEGARLTAGMERHLARHIVSEYDLRRLATKGLRVTEDITDTALKDCKGDVTEAALFIIRAWSSGYTDRERAYSDLCKSLRRIGRISWIKELAED